MLCWQRFSEYNDLCRSSREFFGKREGYVVVRRNRNLHFMCMHLSVLRYIFLRHTCFSAYHHYATSVRQHFQPFEVLPNERVKLIATGE